MSYETWDTRIEPAHAVLPPRVEDVVQRFDARRNLDPGPVAQAVESGPITWHEGDAPTPEQVGELFDPLRHDDVWRLAASKIPEAHILRLAILPARGKSAHPLTVETGRRYTRLRTAVAQLSNWLSGEDGVSPEILYALLFRQVVAWEPDQDGTDFLKHLWTFCEYYWSKDRAAARAKTMEFNAERMAEASKIQQMVEGMRSWCPQITHLVGTEAELFVKRHLIAYLGGRSDYFLMDSTGSYMPTPLNKDQLPSAIDRQGLAGIVSLRNEEGKWRTAQDLVNRHGTAVGNIEFVVGRTSSQIKGIDTADATLSFGTYTLREDLEPRFSSVVDEWLHALVGDRQYPKLAEWLGHALAFEVGALPLLALTGAPNAGKKLVVMGLVECLKTPLYATGDDVWGDWHDTLLRSPIVWTDEGWPQKIKGKHPADRLREIIGAPVLKVQRKFMPVVDLRSNPRIILTANSDDIVTRFGQGRSLNADALAAVSERILHLHIQPTAPKWLKDRGGMQFTAAPGARWIAPDGTGHSDYVVARHFLWLHRKLGYGTESPPLQTERFLMSGGLNNTIQRRLRMSSGYAASVVRILIDMLNSYGETPTSRKGVQASNPLYQLGFVRDRQQNWHLFVQSGGVEDFARANDSYRGSRIPNARRISETLRGQLNKEIDIEDFDQSEITATGDGRYRLESRNKLRYRRWVSIDLEALKGITDEWDLPCPLLDHMLTGAEVLPMPSPRQTPLPSVAMAAPTTEQGSVSPSTATSFPGGPAAFAGTPPLPQERA